MPPLQRLVRPLNTHPRNPIRHYLHNLLEDTNPQLTNLPPLVPNDARLVRFENVKLPIEELIEIAKRHKSGILNCKIRFRHRSR